MTDRAAVQRPRFVAVIGDGDPRGPDAHRLLESAEEVGQLLARGGAVVVDRRDGWDHAGGLARGRRCRWRDDRHPSRDGSVGSQRVREDADRHWSGCRAQLRCRHGRRRRRRDWRAPWDALGDRHRAAHGTPRHRRSAHGAWSPTGGLAVRVSTEPQTRERLPRWRCGWRRRVRPRPSAPARAG